MTKTESTTETFDVFVSHAWVDQLPERVAARPERGGAGELARRLKAAGLRVFYDNTEIADGDPITAKVRDGLANSSTFVAWYSDEYPTRQACQWELDTAVRIDISKAMILAVNPEETGEHLDGTPLKDGRAATAPAAGDEAAWTALVDQISGKVATAHGAVFGELHEVPVRWYPDPKKRADRFTGRQRELWRLHETLTAHRLTGQKTAFGGAAVVDGMGGAGKTVLALEYGHRYGAAWPGGIVWIRGHGFDHGNPEGASPDERRQALYDEYLNLAIAIDVDLSALTPIDNQNMRLKKLRQLVGAKLDGTGPVLWIVDDLPPGLTDAEVEMWQAPGNLSQSMTLLTTRTTEYRYAFTPLALDQLTPADGYRLVTQTRPPANDEQRRAAETLVELLGGFALALDVTRAAIAHPADYSKWLDKLNVEVANSRFVDNLDSAGQLAGTLIADHSNSVAVTLKMSIDRLDEPGKTVLRTVCCFDSLPIPFDVIEALIADGVVNSSEVVDGAGVVDCEERRRRGVASVEKASLGNTGHDASLTVHRVVGRIALSHFGLSPNDAQQAHETAAVAINNAMSTMLASGAASGYQSHLVLAVSLHVDQETELRLRGWQGFYLSLAGRTNDAITILERVAEQREQLLGSEHPGTLAAWNNLADSYRAAGRPTDAISIQARVADQCERLFGSEDPNTLTTWANLATSYQATGRNGDAITILERVAQQRERVLGNEHPSTLTTWANLAVAYQSGGRTTDAITIQAKVAEQCERILDPEHPDTLTAWANLATSYQMAGRIGDAITILERVAQQRERILGNEHPSTLTTWTNLAVTYQSEGRTNDAITILERVAEQRERILGPEHPSTLTTWTNLALSYRAAGRTTDAVTLAKEW